MEIKAINPIMILVEASCFVLLHNCENQLLTHTLLLLFFFSFVITVKPVKAVANEETLLRTQIFRRANGETFVSDAKCF